MELKVCVPHEPAGLTERPRWLHTPELQPQTDIDHSFQLINYCSSVGEDEDVGAVATLASPSRSRWLLCSVKSTEKCTFSHELQQAVVLLMKPYGLFSVAEPAEAGLLLISLYLLCKRLWADVTHHASPPRRHVSTYMCCLSSLQLILCTVVGTGTAEAGMKRKGAKMRKEEDEARR